MRRSQVYLSERHAKLLKTLARARGTTVSDLIRQAIDAAYAVPGAEEFIRAVDRAAGVWRDRRDLRNPDRFLRDLRRGCRPRMTPP